MASKLRESVSELLASIRGEAGPPLARLVDVVREESGRAPRSLILEYCSLGHGGVLRSFELAATEGLRGRAFIMVREPPGELVGAACRFPFAYKDSFHVPGETTGAGTPYLRVEPRSLSRAVESLESMGGVPVGRTNMHELGLGTTNVNKFYGTPVNPVAPERIPGGSSGGSACAVASGIVPLALGSDTAGSVRVPAAYTGTYGLMLGPRLSRNPGMLRLTYSFDSLGVITGEPLDALLVAGQALSSADLRGVGRLVESYFRSSPPILLYPSNLASLCSREVCDTFSAAIDRLESLGAVVREERVPHLDRVERARASLVLYEIGRAMAGLYRRYSGLMGEDAASLIRLGLRIGEDLALAAFELMSEYRAMLRQYLARFDAIVTPTVPIDAPRVSEADWTLSSSNKLVLFTGIWNVMGYPAASVPARKFRMPSGIPLPLQVASARGLEEVLATSIYIYHMLG